MTEGRCAQHPDGLDVQDVCDPDDPRLDDFRDLNSIDRRPDLPTGKALVIAEGVLVVQRMLASRFTPLALFGTDRRLAELKDDLAGVGAPYYRASADVMARVIGFHLNRGVLAAARRVPEPSVAQVVAGARTVAVLEGVNDHENLGSIFRNAAGLSVDAVVFGTGCADPLYRRAVRVSMGHALLVPYARAADWPTELMTLKESGFRLLAMTPHGNACKLPEAIAAVSHERIALLVGAEGPGLTAAALRISDVRVRIPMSRGPTPSTSRRRPHWLSTSGLGRAITLGPARERSARPSRALGNGFGGRRLRRRSHRGCGRGAEPRPDPRASAVGRRSQHCGGQRVGPYAVGLAPHPSAALVRAWRGSGRGGRRQWAWRARGWRCSP